MEIVIRIDQSTLNAAVANALAGKTVLAAEPKKPGRPKKEKPADEPEETEVEENDEPEETEEEVEEPEETEEVEEPEVVSGEQLAKVKAALQAFSKAKKSKDAAVKVLHKFAKSSEKVKVADYKKLLLALKV